MVRIMLMDGDDELMLFSSYAFFTCTYTHVKV